MPKNINHDNTIGKWKFKSNSDLLISLETKKKKDLENINLLFQLLYGQSKICTSIEKEIIINQFFADLFDGKLVKWSVLINQEVDIKLEHLLNKYLERTNFILNLWQTKFKSGIFGKYAIVIIEETIGEDNDGEKITQPKLIPARIIYANYYNQKMFEAETLFENSDYQNGQIILNLKRNYSLMGNKIIIISSLINQDTNKEIIDSELNENLKTNLALGQKTLDYDFIPISILSNNVNQTPRTKNVHSRMEMLDKFDEMLAILPAWEKGAILTNTSSVTAPNQEEQNQELMKNLLLKGFNQFKQVEADGMAMNLTENIVLFKPNSIMKNVKKTRDLIWNEIKEDLGLPFLAENEKSENLTQQFLNSPILEREKLLMKMFLKDLAKKFLIVLSNCNIKDDFPKDIDWNNVEINVEFELLTKNNINETTKQFSNIRSAKEG